MTGESNEKASLRDLVVLVIVVITTGYSAWYYRGIYKLIAEAELRFLGSFNVMITILLTAIITMIPLLVIVRFVVPDRDVPGFGYWSRRMEYLTRYLDTYEGTAWTLAVVMFTVAGFIWCTLPSRTEFESLDVSLLERDPSTAPSTGWFQAEGVFRTELAHRWVRDGSERSFVPFVSTSWKSGSPIALIVEMNPTDAAKLGSEPTVARGFARPLGLPGPLRSRWEQSSEKPTEEPVVLQRADDTERSRKALPILLTLGAICIAVGLFFDRRKTHRRSAYPSIDISELRRTDEGYEGTIRVPSDLLARGAAVNARMPDGREFPIKMAPELAGQLIRLRDVFGPGSDLRLVVAPR